MNYYYCCCIGKLKENNIRCERCEDNTICRMKTHLNREEEKEKCRKKENALENT